MIMTRPESIAIERHITTEELNKIIKSLEKDVKVLKRLYFIKYRCEGIGVEESVKKLGFQNQWHTSGKMDGIKKDMRA